MVRWGPLKSLLALSPVLVGAPWYALVKHYSLPGPIEPTSAITPSERQILSHVQHLSETIGYRTPGTREHAQSDEWMKAQVEELVRLCEGEREGELMCEGWWQVGSASHRFDMMGHRLYKTYVNLTNHVLRVSPHPSLFSQHHLPPSLNATSTVAGTDHAILINAHLDSTLPSPGAADDAISVGVMIETARALISDKNFRPAWSVVFLWNGAEESLQDASHLFSTQHPIAPTIRAVINLEAAGTTGPELLFQATSDEMVEAYSRVPRPFGTVIAHDVFSSGILLSDTDFRQFQQYLDVPGLDMAVVGNSYLYHMRKDLVENIQPGVAQHMAETTLALIRHLTNPQTPSLPTLALKNQDVDYVHQTRTVYFSYLGYFFLFSYETAAIVYKTLLIASVLLVRLSAGRGWGKNSLRGCAAVLLGLVGSLVGVIVVAALMRYGIVRPLSWFKGELEPIGLYAAPALFGALLSQNFLSPLPESALLHALLIFNALSAFVLHTVGIGSGVMFALTGVPLFIAIALQPLLSPSKAQTRDTSEARVSLWTYALGSVTPLLTGAQVVATTLDVFVPLTGRIGRDAPSEFIIASIVALTGAYALPLILPFYHRFHIQAVPTNGKAKGEGKRKRKQDIGGTTMTKSTTNPEKKLLLGLGTLTVLTMALFAVREPFDSMHQRRVFIIHAENTTTNEHKLHVAASDPAPGFEALVSDIATEFGLPGSRAEWIQMSDWNADWDILYPFSAFISPYAIDLPVDSAYANESSVEMGKYITVRAVNDMIDEERGMRSLKLVVHHPGVIWSTIAFDAHVLQWTLDDHPPKEHARHHIKEASFYGIDQWSIDLTIKHPSPSLKINYVGIKEQAMWPGKKKEKEAGGAAMRLFEKLDEWIERRTAGSVDPLLIGCVGGVTVV